MSAVVAATRVLKPPSSNASGGAEGVPGGVVMDVGHGGEGSATAGGGGGVGGGVVKLACTMMPVAIRSQKVGVSVASHSEPDSSHNMSRRQSG